MAYKEKQLNEAGARALTQAWGQTNADMVKGKKKSPAKKTTPKKPAGKKTGK